jgi:RNA polymerase sigma-70 factor (ECF subfamily)
VVNPQNALEQKEFLDILYQCIAKLPARLADVFMLREFDALNTKTICRLMDITESNTWVMLFRARMNLRTCLTDKWLKGNQ